MRLDLQKIGLIGLVSLLLASMFANWWLLRETSSLSGDLSVSRANEAVLRSTLETLKQQSEAADASTSEYINTIQTLRKERDSLRRAVQSARKTDADYRKWADTVLPRFVVDKYHRMHEASSSSSSRRDLDRTKSPTE